jgi:hypothetical protein
MLTNTLVFWSTGAEAERKDIPSAVPVEDVTPETQEAAVEASEPMAVVAGEAAATSGGDRPLAGDPRRGAHPLGVDDGSRYE